MILVLYICYRCIAVCAPMVMGIHAATAAGYFVVRPLLSTRAPRMPRAVASVGVWWRHFATWAAPILGTLTS